MSDKIVFKNLDEIERAAKEFLAKIGDSKVIALYGSMGVGKTTFTKALCKILGVIDIVNSPTFAIINEYLCENGSPVYHFDFYRIETISEALDIGFDEYLDSGEYCIIEWSEKVERLLPDNTLKVDISLLDDETRVLTF